LDQPYTDVSIYGAHLLTVFQTTCSHSSIPPKKRAELFDLFVNGSKPILVSTDIASRGLDFNSEVAHIILFDFPLNPIDYLHRVGRTGRAGKIGTVTSLLRKRDLVLARGIQNAIRTGQSLEKLSATKSNKQKSINHDHSFNKTVKRHEEKTIIKKTKNKIERTKR